ncbi:MAG: hypothetical protein K6U04_01505 [Armatimonadetes bacterium]|nr:hypothetical protein [Armatimonadota bacterium]
MDFWAVLDLILISFYRLTGNPVLDFFLGTFGVAFLVVLIGEFTISLVFKANKRHLESLNVRLSDLHRLSMAALRLGDKKSYRACNKEANDTFGQVFFNMFGLSAASLWPAFFALSWMQQRFAGIGFPLPFTGYTVNYVVPFLICYILSRMLFGRVKHKLPYFKGVSEMLAACEKNQ